MARLRIAHFHFRTRHNVGDAAVVAAMRMLLEVPLARPRWTSYRMRLLASPPTPGLLDEVNRHDLVIMGGGGFYSRWGLPVADEFLDGLRIPLVLFAGGLNRNLEDQPLDPLQLDSIRRLHESAALAGVRDSATAGLLAWLGLEVPLVGDPALFIRPRRPWWPLPARRPRFALNLAAHGWAGQQRWLAPAIEATSAALGELARKHEASLCYLVHADAERRLLPLLRRLMPGLHVRRYRPAELRWAYGELDLVVSMMLHSSILAAAAGVPAVNIAYDDKNEAFLRDIGASAWGLPIAGLAPGPLLELAENRLAAGRNLPPLVTARERLAASMEHFISRIAQLAMAREAQ